MRLQNRQRGLHTIQLAFSRNFNRRLGLALSRCLGSWGCSAINCLVTAAAAFQAVASKLTSAGTQFHWLYLPLARNRHCQKLHIQFFYHPATSVCYNVLPTFFGSLCCICKVRWFCNPHPALYLRLEPLNKVVQHLIVVNICALIQPLQETRHIISDIPTLLPTAQFLPSIKSIVRWFKIR